MKRKTDLQHTRTILLPGKIPIQTAVYLLLMFFLVMGQTVKRGREEGAAGIPASNVMGNGNITAYAAAVARYSLAGFAFDPVVGARIGISDMMQLYGHFIPVAGKGLGPVEAHLQITTPGNENLRFFGVALRADLFLSNIQDTLSLTTQADKPEYNPYLFPSLIADLDWLALWKNFPVKTYLAIGMMDNMDLLPWYNQLYVRSALEWKMYQHSVFAAMGFGLYQEKMTKVSQGENSYSQSCFWVEPGGRYRLFNRISMVGSVKLTLFQNTKQKNPLKPELFHVSVQLEAPIMFKETNTEAIRTLIFMEGRKNKKLDSFEKSVAAGKSLIGDMNSSLFGFQDSLDRSDFLEEKEAIKKRREETQKKMDEIERLFMQMSVEERAKLPSTTDTVSTGKKQ